jgi:hypothetical protein
MKDDKNAGYVAGVEKNRDMCGVAVGNPKEGENWNRIALIWILDK